MVGSKVTDHHQQMGVDDAVEPPSKGVPCSICLDLVSDTGDRSRAKLHCGHEFHLDCIGSAFNRMGAMQCPKCQKIERGQWLYANGSSRSLPVLSTEDWIADEDFYDPIYSEMPFRVHWCPFGELTQVGSSFGSGPRGGSSFVSSVVPCHPGSGVPTHERIQASHAFFHHHQPSSNSPGLPTPVIPGIRRFDGPRSLPAVVPTPLQHDQNGGFYVFPPSSSSQNARQADNPLLSHFQVWERERLSRFPCASRDSSWRHQNTSGSDLSNRSGSFWHMQSS